jgi:hypothetical protein
MSTIQIGDEIERQLKAFKTVVDAVCDETMEWQTYVEMVLLIGLDQMRMGIIGKPELAIITLRKLADLEPETVYKLMALALEKGNEMERAEARRRLEECKKTIL